MDLAHLRENYSNKPLLEENVSSNPVEQFKIWMCEAVESNLPEPNSFVLSTIDYNGNPTSRVLLLKGVDSGKFVFYTNYLSEKAKHIERNNNVSLNFLWLELARQVRISGRAVKTSAQASDAYFFSRPIGSQIGAHVSEQSSKIGNRDLLDLKLAEMTAFFKTNAITRPEHWGGFEVEVTSIEFWKGRPDRLHDRLLYTKRNEETWEMVRLAP
jgi:pyridoxamine 5'-phosphate oxidase